MVDVTLVVVVLLYFVALVGVGVYAKQQKDRVAQESGEIASQFSGSYSTGVLMITTASSIFSGATVVGIPGEVGTNGYTAVRWFLAMSAIVASMTILYPRLRRLAVAKGFGSPNDFVFHRYKSPVLRALTMLASALAGVIYLSIQFNAFGGQFSAITGYDTTVGMVCFGVLVLVMEQIGGLSSVVYTDVLQGVVMTVCFLVLPIVLWLDYGGFWGMAPADCDHLRYWNTNTSTTCAEMSAGPDCVGVGCIGNTNPDFLLYPESESMITAVFWFVFGMLAYPLNLQLLQRCYISRSETSLRTVLFALIGAAVIAYSPGIYLGIAHAANKQTFSAGTSPHAFFGMMQVFSNQGGVHKLLMTVTTCSYLAAVMSTTDSVILGVSSTVSQDLVKGIMVPDMEQSRVVVVGMLISLVQVVLGIIGGRGITPPQYGYVLSLSNGFLFQVMPCYLLGLFFSITAMPLIVGLVAGMGSSLIFGLWAPVPNVPAPFAGLFVNVLVVAVAWFASTKAEGAADMTAQATALVRLAKGRRLPPVWLPIAAFLICMGMTPIWQEAGSVQSVSGMPAHAWVMMGGAALAALLSIASLLMWDADSDESRPSAEEAATELAS